MVAVRVRSCPIEEAEQPVGQRTGFGRVEIDDLRRVDRRRAGGVDQQAGQSQPTLQRALRATLIVWVFSNGMIQSAPLQEAAR